MHFVSLRIVHATTDTRTVLQPCKSRCACVPSVDQHRPDIGTCMHTGLCDSYVTYKWVTAIVPGQWMPD